LLTLLGAGNAFATAAGIVFVLVFYSATKVILKVRALSWFYDFLLIHRLQMIHTI